MYIFLVVCVYILVVYILVVYILVYIYIIIIIYIFFLIIFFICSLDNSWSKLFSLDCDEDEISI